MSTSSFFFLTFITSLHFPISLFLLWLFLHFYGLVEKRLSDQCEQRRDDRTDGDFSDARTPSSSSSSIFACMINELHRGRHCQTNNMPRTPVATSSFLLGRKSETSLCRQRTRRRAGSPPMAHGRININGESKNGRDESLPLIESQCILCPLYNRKWGRDGERERDGKREILLSKKSRYKMGKWGRKINQICLSPVIRTYIGTEWLA